MHPWAYSEMKLTFNVHKIVTTKDLLSLLQDLVLHDQ